MSKFMTTDWKKDILEKNALDIQKKYPEFWSELTVHTKKYAWVYYVYAGPAFSEEDFLAFIRDYLEKGIDPKEKLQYEKQRREENTKLKADYIERLKPVSFFKLIFCKNGKIITLTGNEAHAFTENQVKRVEEKKEGTGNELKGSVAFAGKAKGIVKIINRQEDMYKMKQGDVLVSAATTPSIVPAMKKAVAIVTDEGGLTCHASIVSRELGIVCVVGTKFATKILKDGDVVEVDAEKGIVTILKK